MTTRVVVVTQDDPFYMPVFFESFFGGLPSDVTVESVVLLDAFGESLPELVRRMYRLYGPVGFVRRGVSFAVRTAIDAAGIRAYSVRSVARSQGVSVVSRSSVNDDAFVESLHRRDIDVVLSAAAPEIFDAALLDTPEWCLNVHTADLPKYRGMLPTFWALYHGESEVGVTVHTMTEEIDEGKAVARSHFDISDTNSLDEVIRRGKRTGGRLAAEVLGQVDRDELDPEPIDGEGSYFSFPTKEQRREFQRKGYELL
jgi:methionyl-tRNA formyltransferase